MIPCLLGAVVFGFLGLSMFCSGIFGIVRRRQIADFMPEMAGHHVFYSLFSSVAGASMLLGAVLLWSHWVLGLVLGLWPIAVFGSSI